MSKRTVLIIGCVAAMGCGGTGGADSSVDAVSTESAPNADGGDKSDGMPPAEDGVSAETSAPPSDAPTADAAPTTDGSTASGTDASTFLVKRGALTFSDDFSTGSLAPNWLPVMGVWSEAGGHLLGSQGTAKVDYFVGHMMAGDRVVVQFDFSYTGTGIPGLRFNHKETANFQHLIHLQIDPKLVTLSQMSGVGSTTTSKPIGTGAVSLLPNQWYTAVFEIYDTNIVFSIDGKKVVAAATIDQSAFPKNQFLFQAGGASVMYRSFRVWDAIMM
ncbi:MAG: hypothetical protein NVSMB1_00610 [Polyangiales bacterium]